MTDAPPVTAKRPVDWRLDAPLLVLLLVVVAFVWSRHYDRRNWHSLEVPINYVGGRYLDMVFTGDGLWGMTFAKLAAAGEAPPLMPKYPTSIGAPFPANWNDWPTFEEPMNIWWALLVRAFGVFTGSNLATLSAHLLAAATFYAVCRYLGYHQFLSFAGAALFALSRYAFWRNLPNLAMTFYWHLPLGLLVLWWCIRERSILGQRKKLLFCFAVAVIFGSHMPYYSGMFLQLLFWAALYCWFRWRDWQRVLLPVGIGAALFGSIVLMNVDTFYSWYRHGGPNAAAAPRMYFDVERYALKPVELFLPLSHSLASFAEWADKSYYKVTMIPTEQGSAYIGIVAMFGLALLLGKVIVAVARRDLRAIPPHFWALCLISGFAVLGGLNGIIGLAGFRFFRAGNRYSILIFTVLLLYLVKQLNFQTRRYSGITTGCISLSLLALGIYDQVPPRSLAHAKAVQRAWREDEALVKTMEEQLAPGSMIFQLPVHDFPEAYLIGKEDDYEQFRPYLHTDSFRFSYGDIKGRYQSRWQKEADLLGTSEMAKLLERYGFSAVIIDREAYSDRGAWLLNSFRGVAGMRVLSRSRNWICLTLNAARRPELPPVFADGWSPLGGVYGDSKRWIAGRANVLLQNVGQKERNIRLSFGILASSPRTFAVAADGETLLERRVVADGTAHPLELAITLKPGDNIVQFMVDNDNESGQNPDPRTAAFAVTNFRIE